ncbi:protein NEN1 [Amborella trichopoda]|uniref:Exonuclease domain-containing protein n=1 Tax=Amborella trichopoda TaxID=13333 RepID=W1NGG3_AMBTC|nr:protein NEN1 [Amborella trichopoda]ERM94571.1 hypothetical protein AMTR_s00010p00268040 [Amborella trichopoda]|eukprot:XP_006827334.1 protein NEN1 [Amborella trichopoda]
MASWSNNNSINSNSNANDRSEIVFFDLETTVPFRNGAQKFELLEFGAILVCPKKLVELESFSTLVRPSNLSSVSPTSVKCNGITRDMVATAPTFLEIADRVYDILHGRVWAGHNIVRFDCARIREAFADIGRPAPEPKALIDSLALLTQKFGRRAGNMKMASLATYFGLGQQKHRSLEDVRMNLEVLKYCATVLFLESSLPEVLSINSLASPNMTTRSRTNGNSPPKGTSTPSLGVRIQGVSISPSSSSSPGNGEPTKVFAPPESNTSSMMPNADPIGFSQLIDQMRTDPTRASSAVDEENPVSNTCGVLSNMEAPPPPPLVLERNSFLEPNQVSPLLIHASLVPYFRGCHKVAVFHGDDPLQLCCANMRVRFGVSSRFVNLAGRPRLSIVVEAPPLLCQVLEKCDQLAQKASLDNGSSSEWRPVLIRKNGFFSNSNPSPAIRLNIPTMAVGDGAIYTTEISQRETSGSVHKLVFSKVDTAELDSLLVPGCFVDGHFGLDVYDYQQNAGIRLVAKRLIVRNVG